MSAAGTSNLSTITIEEMRANIFGTRESLQFLQNSENWFIDGTFSTAPPQFVQLYTAHGLSNEKNIVGAYCLLVNKRMERYAYKLSSTTEYYD